MRQFIILSAVILVASAHHEHSEPYSYPSPSPLSAGEPFDGYSYPRPTPSSAEEPYNYPRPNMPFSAERYSAHDDSGLQVAPLRAIVKLSSPVGNEVQGNVTFTQLPDGKIHVEGHLFGLPKGEYGFHVHEKGDITGGCMSTGAHFNPEHKDHGHPSDTNRHVGDLGNVVFDESRVSNIDFNDSSIALVGPHGILGRAVVLHERADDFGKTDHPDSRKTGNAGGRVACGVIGILDPVYGPWKNAAALLSPIISVILVPIAAWLLLK